MIASFKLDALLRVLGVRADRACHYSQLSAQLLLAQARDARTPQSEREAEGVTEFARTLPLLLPSPAPRPPPDQGWCEKNPRDGAKLQL